MNCVEWWASALSKLFTTGSDLGTTELRQIQVRDCVLVGTSNAGTAALQIEVCVYLYNLREGHNHFRELNLIKCT